MPQADLKNMEESDIWSLLAFSKELEITAPIVEEIRYEDGAFHRGGIIVQDSLGQGRVDEIFDRLRSLIFVNCFKILDTLVIWIILESKNNGRHIISSEDPVGWRFKLKKKQLLQNRSDLLLPPPLSSDAALQEAIVHLYTNLIEPRNAVVHRYSFHVSNGVFRIDYGATTGVLQLDNYKLTWLARIIYVLEQCLEGTTSYDAWTEKTLKAGLDVLKDIHQQPLFGQDQPIYYKVKVEPELQAGKYHIDLAGIRRKFSSLHPDKESIFDLQIEGRRNTIVSDCWRIPFSKIPHSDTWVLDPQDYPESRLPLP